MRDLTAFLPSVDNLTTNVKDVHSLMIVPVFGHKARMVATENGVQEGIPGKEEDRKPIAILQFINKLHLREIDEYDLAKIDAMKDLLGMSIDNASEHHSVINARVCVQENLGGLTKNLAEQEANAEAQKVIINDLLGSSVPRFAEELMFRDGEKQENNKRFIRDGF